MLGDAVYGIDGQDMEEVVGALLLQRNDALRCRVLHRRADQRKDNEYRGQFRVLRTGRGGLQQRRQTELLGVPADLIEQHGAVSREVAAAMAQGIRERAKTGLGLAVTGIAGPSGGTPRARGAGVHLPCVARWDQTTEHRFLGTRSQVRQRTAQMALGYGEEIPHWYSAE